MPKNDRPNIPMRIIGLISGTSADGIDAAVVEVTGAPPQLDWRLHAFTSIPYPPALKARVFGAFQPATATVDKLCSLNFAIGEAFADAALQAAAAAGFAPEQIDLIGSHGQTVWHIPEGPDASTLQLGEAAVIAERTAITIVSNFRTRDMAAGGQGAPLASWLDVLLLTDAVKTRAAQNIGGIGNVTYLPPAASADRPLAFDTGPGNVLIDHMIGFISNGQLSYDAGGALAASGTVHEGLLATLLREPYLALPAPKTTGRELFTEAYARHIFDLGRRDDLSDADLVATTTAFTAHTIARAYADLLPSMPDELLVSGGGAHNRTLLAMLADALPHCTISTVEEAGLPSDAKEAIAFALIAYESFHGRPGNLPAATGADRAVIMGSITPGRIGYAPHPSEI